MAKKIILTDDMEGGDVPADAGTIPFALDGKEYEIDLCVRNATKMRGDIGRYVEFARPAVIHPRKRHRAVAPAPKTDTPPKTSRTSGYDTDQLRAVRRWARKNGWPELGDKGRIPDACLDAFEAAGGISLIPEFSA